MTGYPGGVRHGTSGPHNTSRVQEQALNSGPHGGILRGGFPRFWGGDSGGPAVPHNFRCGNGSSDESLYLVGCRRRRREGQVWNGGASLYRIFLCIQQTSCINVPSLVAGRILHPHWIVWLVLRKFFKKMVGMLYRP